MYIQCQCPLFDIIKAKQNTIKNNIYSQTVCSFVLLYASCVFLYVNGGHLKKIGGHLAALADLKYIIWLQMHCLNIKKPQSKSTSNFLFYLLYKL